MAVTAQYPSSQNVFVKDHESTNKMVVDFSRKPEDFAVAEYAQYVPVKKISGLYLRMTVEEAGRIMSGDGARFIWPDGAVAREGNEGTESFAFYDYLCKRYQYPVTLGDRMMENASWDIMESHVRIKTQQAMTDRTARVINVATTAANYGSNTSTCASITGGGKMDESTTARGDIKRVLNYMAETILKSCLAAVNINDFIFVVSPGWCRKVSQSQEIIDHIKGSPDALAQIRGELPGRNAIFGMPDKLYGFPLVVEKTVKVTSAKGASRASDYILADTTPFMISRPGGLEGVAGAPSFSTLTVFFYEEMTVERLRDENNRRTLGRIVSDFDVQMTAPSTGYLLTGAVN